MATTEIEQHEQELTGDEVTRLRAAVGRLSRDLRRTVAGSSLTPSQTSVLFTIVRRESIGLSELAEFEGLNPTMLSRVTSQLCELGLIKRESRPEDRRAGLVRPTAAGRRMRERVHRERTKVLEEYVRLLSEGRREQLWQALPALEQLSELIRAQRT